MLYLFWLTGVIVVEGLIWWIFNPLSGSVSYSLSYYFEDYLTNIREETEMDAMAYIVFILANSVNSYPLSIEIMKRGKLMGIRTLYSSSLLPKLLGSGDVLHMPRSLIILYRGKPEQIQRVQIQTVVSYCTSGKIGGETQGNFWQVQLPLW